VNRDEDFAAYMSRRWTALVHAAILLGCTLHEAEDIAQTALTRCYVSWSRIERATTPDAYVYRILVNTYNDSRRRRWWGERPTDRLPESTADPDPTAEVDGADSMKRALSELSVEQRGVVVLRYFAQLSEQDTADALGVAVGTVKSRTARALSALATSPHLAQTHDGNSS
jgi:RNA polymerase sigma-70 factor (sigma-E family)